MGRFSTTVHIKANADFLSAYTEMMKKRGFEPCKEDEAALSYLIAQSNGWATIAGESYNENPRQASEDADLFSKELNTSAFSVEVVDSDFAILKLNGDEVIVGDGSGYGIEDAPRGNKKLWEPLLVSGTFEDLDEIWGANEVFVEDALCKSAPLLGIDPDYIFADFRDLSENADGDKNITALCFKKIGASKPMTLNAAFKKVFGEVLEPLGYQLIKGKYPYFVRVVSDEIIHVISYYNDKKCYDRDHDYIQIKGGVATVYRPEIDLMQNPRRENWLTTNCDIYIYRLEHNLEKRDDELKRQLYNHPSLPDENLKAMEYQLALTKRFILPALDKAMTIDSCIENDFEIRMSLTLYDDGSFGTTEGNGYYDEGMLYFKTDRSVYENITRNAVNEGVLRRRAYFERVHNDHELYNEVQAELERRKAANTEILRSYGLDI